MDTKLCKLELIEQVSKCHWNIEFLGDPFEEKQFSKDEIISFGIGDVFDFGINKRETIINANLTKIKPKEVFDLPFFLCITPIWFVDKDVLYMTFITGDKLCSLRKVAFRFDGLGTKEPKFFFSVTPSSDCVCADCCKDKLTGAHRVMAYSMGGGSGTTDNH